MTFSISGRPTSSPLTLDFQDSSFEDLTSSSEVESFSETSSSSSTPAPLDTPRRFITKNEAKRLRELLFTVLKSKDNKYLLNFNLIHFFQNLRIGLNTSPSLCGSSVSYILFPKEPYKDKDFIIPITLSITSLESPCESFNMHVASLIRGEALKVRNLIQDLIIEIFHRSYPTLSPSRLEIFNQFFSSQFLKIDPIAFEKEKKGNRFSLLKFGEIELKFTYDLSITWEKDHSSSFIPGLENPCAFDKDSLQIPLDPILDAGFVDLRQTEIISVSGSINDALLSVKIGELKTTSLDGSKFIKLIDYITFRSAFCDRDLALQLLENFSEKFSIEEIEMRIETYFSDRLEKNKLGVILSLLNIHNLAQEKALPLLQKKIKQIILSLLNTRSNNFIIENFQFEPLIIDWMLIFITLFSDKVIISKEKNQHFYSLVAESTIYSLLRFDVIAKIKTLLESPLDLLPLYKNILFQIRAGFSIKNESALIQVLIDQMIRLTTNSANEFLFFEFLHSYKKHPFEVSKRALFAILKPDISPHEFLTLIPHALMEVKDKRLLLTKFDRYVIDDLNIMSLEKETSTESAKCQLIKILLENCFWHSLAISLFETVSQDSKIMMFEAFIKALQPNILKLFFKKYFSQFFLKVPLETQTSFYTHAIKKFEMLPIEYEDYELFQPIFSSRLLSESLIENNKAFLIVICEDFLKRKIACEEVWDFLIYSKLLLDDLFLAQNQALLKQSFKSITKENESLNKKLLFIKDHLETSLSSIESYSFRDFFNDEISRLIQQEECLALKSLYLIEYGSNITLSNADFGFLFEVSNYLIETKNKDHIIKIDTFFKNSLKLELCQKADFHLFFTFSLSYINSLLENNNTLLEAFVKCPKAEIEQQTKYLLKAFELIGFFFLNEIEMELIDVLALYPLFENALKQLENVPVEFVVLKDINEIAQILIYYICHGYECQKAFLSLVQAITKGKRADLLPVLENIATYYSHFFGDDLLIFS
jgi:hypothetical protein